MFPYQDLNKLLLHSMLKLYCCYEKNWILKSVRGISRLIKNRYLVISAIYISGSKSLLQAGFISFMITQMLLSDIVFQLHTIQQSAAQEVLMLSNQANHRDGSKDQIYIFKLKINDQSRFQQK